jgi:hypothetical protein
MQYFSPIAKTTELEGILGEMCKVDGSLTAS